MVLSNYKKSMLKYGKPEVFRKAIAKEVVEKREKVMKDAVAKAAADDEGGLMRRFFG